MRFLVITDLHQKASNIEWINKLIESERTDAVLFLGDVTDMGTSDDAVEIRIRKLRQHQVVDRIKRAHGKRHIRPPYQIIKYIGHDA